MIEIIELEDMFLDDMVQIKVGQIRNSNKEIFKLIKEFNKLFYNIVKVLKNRKMTNKDVYIATMFYKMGCSYQSYILLLERGLYDDSQVIMRSLCDKIIKTLFVLEKDDNYYILCQDTINKKIKNYNYILETNMAKELKGDILKDAIEELREYQKDKKAKVPNNKEICEKLSLKDLYVQYSFLSDYTHENISTLMNNNLVKDNDIIIGKGFRYEDFSNDVRMIISFFEFIVPKICNYFELEKHLNSFKCLIEDLNMI